MVDNYDQDNALNVFNIVNTDVSFVFSINLKFTL